MFLSLFLDYIPKKGSKRMTITRIYKLVKNKGSKNIFLLIIFLLVSLCKNIHVRETLQDWRLEQSYCFKASRRDTYSNWIIYQVDKKVSRILLEKGETYGFNERFKNGRQCF